MHHCINKSTHILSKLPEMFIQYIINALMPLILQNEDCSVSNATGSISIQIWNTIKVTAFIHRQSKNRAKSC